MNNHIQDIRVKKILIAKVLFRSASLVSQIFLNIYLLKNTNDIQLVALFNIIILVTHLLSFSFFARIVKFGHRNITHVVSLLGLSLVYLLLIMLGQSVIDYYIFFAMGIGFFTGMYWIGYNNNEFDLTSLTNRGNYHGLSKSLKNLTAIIIPPFIGTIIGLNYFGYGYEIAFGVGAILLCCSAFIGVIKIEYVKNTKYSIRDTLKRIYVNKNLLKVVLNSSLMGFSLSNPLTQIILPLLLFSYGTTEMDLGFLVSIFAILTVIASYLFGKFVHYKQYKLIYVLSGIIYVLSVIVLLFFPVYWYVVLFASLLNLLFTFMDVPQSVLSLNIFHEIEGYKEIKSEYMVIKEGLLITGRILAFTCIYFIGDFEALGIKILFGCMALVIMLSMYLFNSITVKHN